MHDPTWKESRREDLAERGSEREQCVYACACISAVLQDQTSLYILSWGMGLPLVASPTWAVDKFMNVASVGSVTSPWPCTAAWHDGRADPILLLANASMILGRHQRMSYRLRNCTRLQVSSCKCMKPVQNPAGASIPGVPAWDLSPVSCSTNICGHR